MENGEDVEMDWSDTTFYDKDIDGPLEGWLDKKPPSKYLYRCGLWLAWLHPSLKAADYEWNRNRRKLTTSEVVDEIEPKAQSLAHEELLNRAMEEGVYKGYWMIFLNSDKDQDEYWKCWVLDFNEMGDKLSYSRLECCRYKNKDPGGIIFVINDNFTDKKAIGKLSKMCKRVTEQNNLDSNKSIYYKPAFYTDVGRHYENDDDGDKRVYASIFWRSLLADVSSCELNHRKGVKDWYKNLTEDQLFHAEKMLPFRAANERNGAK